MFRKLVASFCVLLVSGAVAKAGVMGTSQLIANPPAVNFTTDTDLNNPPLTDTWVSYALGVQSDDGSKISAVKVTIGGQLLQRWNFNADTEAFDPSPSSPNISNGDSHLLATATAAIAPTENNNIVSPNPPTPADQPGARDYGVGTSLLGAWGYVAAQQVTGLNVAYIVIPKGSEPNIDIDVEVSTNPLQTGGAVILDNSDFPGFGGGGGVAPTAMDDTHTTNMAVIMRQLQATGDPTITFENLLPVVGGPQGTATLSATGQFLWHTGTTPRPGTYGWDFTARNEFGTDVGRVTINLEIPEPATISLIGLAMIGLIGFARRR
jgi:hypothetical protein